MTLPFLATFLLSLLFQQEAPAPVVFNHSRSARPGDLVSFQGENFGTAPEVWLGALKLPLENSVGTGWVAVRIPADAKGALVVHLKNGAAASSPVHLNRAWPLHLDALQIVPGGTFRVFGRNLLLPGSTPVVKINGREAAIRAAESDDSMIVAAAPADLEPAPRAAITVDNGNGSGPAELDRDIDIAPGGKEPFKLGVGWTAAFGNLYGLLAVFNPPGDEDKDSSAAIQGAIDDLAKQGGGILQLPEGTFRISKTLTLRSRVVLAGSGKERTILRYDTTNYPVWASGFDLIGLRNLTLANAGDKEGPLLKGNTRVVLQNVRFDLGVSQQLYLNANRNIVVSGCDFVQKGSVNGQGPYHFGGSAGLHFVRNRTEWKHGAPSFQESRDSYIAGNTWIRDASVQNERVITTHCCVIDFCHRVAVVGNTFDVSNGPITNRERNDGETLLTEGGGGHRTENLGAVASATADSITDPANTINVHPFEPKVLPENYGVAIVDGRGAGQTRRVTAYAGKTLTVDRPWDVVPDASSRYACFVWGLEKSLLKNNTLKGNPRGIWLYQCSVRDVDVLENTLVEGGGIYLRTWQSVADKQFNPIYNVRIAGNTVSNTTGIWVSHIGSVFVLKEPRPFGIAQLGIEVRDNRLTANAKNLQLNAEDYAGLEGYYLLLKPEIGRYEAPALSPFLGTIFERNRGTNCDVMFRLGTGADGTILSANEGVNCKSLRADLPSAAGAPGPKQSVEK